MTGFAHLFEHLMFEGSEHHNSRLLPAAAAGWCAAERLDQHRSHQLLGSRADQRHRPRALDGIRSHGLSAACAHARALRDAARRRAQRAASELREPPVWPGVHGHHVGALPGRSSLSLDDDRRRRRPARHAVRGRPGVLPHVLPPVERVARDCRRHRDRAAHSSWPSATSASWRRARRRRRSARRRRSRSRSALVLEDRVEMPRLYMAWHSPADVRAR